jgi:SAM-dependent methyltransferase
VRATNKKNKYLLEFTGERVIPDLVEPALWHEHISRYMYAAGVARGKRVLDAGCGTGYGTACLGRLAAQALGFDISEDAIAFAKKHYGKQAKFRTGSAERFPEEDGSFEVVTAFEVIEHLQNWPRLIEEANRVLTADGLFLVSTPNKAYYAETRGGSGPNPFHVHEFEYDEFRAALAAVFPHVAILGQNRTESFTFRAEETPASSWVDFGEVTESVADAHFYLAVCSKQAFRAPASVYVPGTGNLLRERERHIALLEQQIEDVNRDRTTLLIEHQRMEESVRKRTEWAQQLDGEVRDALRQRDETLEQLHEVEKELDARTAWICKLGSDSQEYAEHRDKTLALIEQHQATIEERTAWARRAEEAVARIGEERMTAVALLDERQKTIEERTEWAKRTEEELARFGEERKNMVALLDERQRTIEERTAWAQRLDAELQKLAGVLDERERTIIERTDWARGLEAGLKTRTDWARELEAELKTRTDWARGLEAELRIRADWARGLEAELRTRADWARGLEAEVASLRKDLQSVVGSLDAARASRWLKLGKSLGLGPKLDATP